MDSTQEVDNCNTLSEAELKWLSDLGVKFCTGSYLTAAIVLKQALPANNLIGINFSSNIPLQQWLELRDMIIKQCDARNYKKSSTQATMSRIRDILRTAYPNSNSLIKRYLTSKRASQKIPIFPPLNKLDSTTNYFHFLSELQTSIPFKTRQKSVASINHTMYAIHELCQKADLLNQINSDNFTENSDNFIKAFTNMCSTQSHISERLIENAQVLTPNKFAAVQVLLKKVFKLEKMAELLKNVSKTRIPIKTPQVFHLADAEKPTDVDEHRMSPSEVQAMSNCATTIMQKMVFYTLFTTGMRVGGMARIKLTDVATYSQIGEWNIKKNGVTLEKGLKRRTFPINSTLSNLFKEWINEHRAFTASPYLFPSSVNENGHIAESTIWNTFRKLAILAGVPIIRAHPHAARHTVGFMMVECGNTIDQVAKFLDHASAETTKKYYVKYSAQENFDRMNIPWIEISEKEKEPAVPKCLTIQPIAKTNDVRNTKKRKSKSTGKSSRRRLLNAMVSMHESYVT